MADPNGIYVPFPPAGALPYVVAHRGISMKAPENTLAAFALAAQTPGVAMVELDARLCRDDVPVVFHDRVLQRTSTGNGPVRSYSLAELKHFDAGSWFSPSFSDERIPTLAEALTLLKGNLWVNIELKSERLTHLQPGQLERAVVATVAETGMKGRVLYSSFNHAMTAEIRRIDAEAHTAVLFNPYRDYFKRPSVLASDAGADVFVCNRRWLRPEMIADAHASAVAVYAYTANNVDLTLRLMSMGVDAIMSDDAGAIAPIVRSGRSA